MHRFSSPRARRLALLSALVAVAFIAALVVLANTDSSKLGVDDFVEYWSAGRLNWTGGNPYSPEQMMVLQLSVNWDEERPLMMWNPPPTLALVMPFGLLPYVPARMLWLAISLVLVALTWHLRKIKLIYLADCVERCVDAMIEPGANAPLENRKPYSPLAEISSRNRKEMTNDR